MQEREQQPEKGQDTASQAAPGSPIATNPNPRANENLPADSRSGGSPDAAPQADTGSEITDGEDA